MKSMSHLSTILIVTLFGSLFTSGASASECASVPMWSENNQYNGCEVVFGADVQFRDPESIPEEACPRFCDTLNEIEEMAKESRALDDELAIPENF